ncbi:Nuclear poly(A) polymerase [Arachis hypogaea]|nr:Nuclear poly(A) polymerase [Arachis hypogaea]
MFSMDHQRSLYNGDYQSIKLRLHLSYGLGVHSGDSDIEALCVAPYFATLSKDFFVVLHDMLKSRPKVSELYYVKSAKVPLMRFKVDGIYIDVSYACLRVLYVPESVDILYLFFLGNIDDTS